MALAQLQIAPAIVTGLFYAVLAAFVGVTVVAVGGGGIAPMRERWERALNTVDAEAPRLKEHARAAKEQRAAYAQLRAQHAMAQQAASAQAATAQMQQPNAAPEYAGQPQFTGQPYPDQQYVSTGPPPEVVGSAAPMPPSAYTGEQARAQAPYPPDATIDLTQQELQRQAAQGGFVPPGGTPDPPPTRRP
jgi:hypothetical protein